MCLARAFAGFHSNGLITEKFVTEYAKRGMGAYVEMIQREERKHNVPGLKHQAWSGAELLDQQMAVASGGASSTAAMGSGVTESQFAPEGAAEQAIEMPLEVPKPAEVISGLAEQSRNNKVSRPGSAATRSDAPSFFRRGGNSMGGAL